MNPYSKEKAKLYYQIAAAHEYFFLYFLLYKIT